MTIDNGAMIHVRGHDIGTTVRSFGSTKVASSANVLGNAKVTSYGNVINDADPGGTLNGGRIIGLSLSQKL